MSCDWLFMAHVHPTIQLEDRFGYRMVEPVWMKGKVSSEKIKKRYKIKELGKLEIAILPTFNRLLGGTSINVEKGYSKLLGPLLRRGLHRYEQFGGIFARRNLSRKDYFNNKSRKLALNGVALKKLILS